MNLLKNPKTKTIAVLNMGIGGNAVLRGGLGPFALSRFDHDIMKQSSVKWLIVFEGVNDIGGSRDSTAAANVAKGLIEAFDKWITQAHAQGIKVYGCTITPIKKSMYYSPFHETARNTVNEWIRTSGHFDAVIDFDKMVRDPADIATLTTTAQSGDYLHPNELGYVMMGGGIDLGLFK